MSGGPRCPNDEIGINDPDYTRGWWLDMPPDTAHYYCPDWQNGVVPVCVPQGNLDDDGYPIGRAARLYEDYERRPRPEARPWIDMGNTEGDPCLACKKMLKKNGVIPWAEPKRNPDDDARDAHNDDLAHGRD